MAVQLSNFSKAQWLVNYYKDLALIIRDLTLSAMNEKKLIARSEEIGKLKEAELPVIGPDYTLEQIEAENREF